MVFKANGLYSSWMVFKATTPSNMDQTILVCGHFCVWKDVPKVNSWHPKTPLFRWFKAYSSVHNKVV